VTKTRRYHHGALRQAVLAAAITAITESGPADISLRDLARRAGVSHAAPAYHFGDKAGVLTAVAAQGYQLLADALDDAQQRTGDFYEVGVAYVRFAVAHRAHFEVMFRPELYHAHDESVEAAQARAAEALDSGVSSMLGGPADPEVQFSGAAAWSIMHGFATLWLNNALPSTLGEDPEAAARAIAGYLFRSPRPSDCPSSDAGSPSSGAPPISSPRAATS
jgi:AcrR family transcriptional regulator